MDVSAVPHTGTGTAFGKVIVLGEHAVVHGAPALALPLTAVAASATAVPTPGPLRLATPVGEARLESAEAAPARLLGLARAAFGALERIGAAPEGLAITVTTTIPVGCGLGSSAAVAIAIVRAIYGAFDAELSPEVEQALADVAERVAHGTPSGLDAHTVAAAGPIWFRRGAGAEPVAVGARTFWVVADTGLSGDTAAAVAGVRARLEAEPEPGQAALATLAVLALEARRALAAGEPAALGQELDRAHETLAWLGVSHPALERLVSTARGAGALGAKLTGAGQGGCMLALAADAEAQAAVAAALEAAGAAGVWCLTTEPTDCEDAHG